MLHLHTKYRTQFLCFILFMVATPLLASEPKDENYTDYLPQYRQFEKSYQIDKIEYREKRIILYFRYVAKEDGTAIFYNGSNPASWRLHTTPRSKGLPIQFNLIEIQDIQVNDQPRQALFNGEEPSEHQVKQGDLVSFQMHFPRIPIKIIKVIDLVEGVDGYDDTQKRNCLDIRLKSKDSPLLGEPEDSKQVLAMFNNKSTGAGNLAQTVSRTTNNQKTAENKVKDGSQTKPITYTPKQMYKMEDISCNERVILPRVVFREDETRFNGRSKSVKDIRVLYNYMQHYPEARMRLHGHTDVFGDKLDNLELSRARAVSVKRELVVMGIDRDRIEVYFYGGAHPLSAYELGGAANRRVEAEVICDGDSRKEQVAIKSR